jgi:hypothetical protein
MASPTPAKARWREHAEYCWLRSLDRAGFAWEFLRRNPDYCRIVGAHGPNIPLRIGWREVRDVKEEEARVAAPWGVHFPCRPIARGA